MIIDNHLFMSLLEQAKRSPRLRINYDFRNSEEDTSQCMLNALLPGTQMSIHRHKQTSETIIVLNGRLTVIFFDENGVESARHALCPTEARYGLQIPKGQWHTIIVTEPCIIFESKDGAYKPLTSDDVWNYE